MKHLLMVFSLFFALSSAWGAGTVTHLAGTLSVKRSDGSVRLLSVKSQVLQGDTLQTEKDSYAQVKFTDGGIMTLKPNTQMVVKDYKYEPQKPAEDALSVGLLKGGLRAVTGLVGKRGDKDAYKMVTGTATIGIRGTIFDADDCKSSTCVKAGADPADKKEGDVLEAGVYVSVRDGEVSVSNSAGTINLAAGQFGFVAASTIAPTVLPGDPGLSAIPSASLLETVTSGGRQGNQCE